MRWSILIARISGIEVRIHATFFLLLGYFAAQAFPVGGWPAAWMTVIFVCLVFFCVLLHEFGHAFAALGYGIRTPDITLWPFGGIARLERMPEKPQQELWIAMAGPLVNIVIALGLWLVLGGSASLSGDALKHPHLALIPSLLRANIVLVLFNLLPAFPMDGGRMLRALLALWLPFARATTIAALIGQALALVLGCIGLFGVGGMPQNPMLVLVAFFVFMAASAETRTAQLRDFTRSVRLEEAMITEFKALPLDARLADAVELLLRTAQHEFPIVETDGRVRGMLTRDDLVAALAQHGQDAPVADHMRRDVPTVPYYAPFEEAFQLMQTAQCPALPVVDRGGRLVGLITPENVGEMLMIHSLLKRDGRLSWRPLRVPGNA